MFMRELTSTGLLESDRIRGLTFLREMLYDLSKKLFLGNSLEHLVHVQLHVIHALI